MDTNPGTVPCRLLAFPPVSLFPPPPSQQQQLLHIPELVSHADAPTPAMPPRRALVTPVRQPSTTSSSSVVTTSTHQPLTIGLLRHYFHLPIQVVAGELGVCTTQLKQCCRRHGIARWPHRKIQSLNNAALQIESMLSKPDLAPEQRIARLAELATLREKKRSLVADPNTDLDLAAAHRSLAASSSSSSSAVSTTSTVPVTPLPPQVEDDDDEDVQSGEDESAAGVLAAVAASVASSPQKRSRSSTTTTLQSTVHHKRAKMDVAVVEEESCEQCEMLRRNLSALQAEHIGLLQERDALRRTVFELQQNKLPPFKQQQQQQQDVIVAPATTPVSEAMAVNTLRGWLAEQAHQAA